MALIFFDKLGHIVLVLDELACLVKGKLLEGLDLGVSERDTFGRKEFAQDVYRDAPRALGIHDSEGREHVFGRCRLEFVGHQDVHHEFFDLLLFDELRGLVVFKLHDNVVTHLCLRWELQQITHQVGHLALVKESATVNVNDAEGFSDLLAIEVFLARALSGVLRRRQHFQIIDY